MSTTLNIYGTCVSRDTFGFFEQDGGFKINQHIMNSCYVSACSDKILDNDICSMDDFPNTKTKFGKRCCALDINKKVFDFLSLIKSDWLIIDLGTLHKSLYRLNSSKKTTFITKTKALEENPEFLKNQNFDILEEIPFSAKNFHLYQQYIPIFAQKLKQIISEEHIIIIEVKFSKYILDITLKNKPALMENKFSAEGIDLRYENDVLLNEMLTELYNNLKSQLPKAHFIPLPTENIPTNPRHCWGFNPMHYVFEAYQYFLDCVKVITSNSEYEDLKIKKLSQMYSDMIYTRYFDNKYDLQNYSTVLKNIVNLGEPVKFFLSSQSHYGKCTYKILHKPTTRKNFTIERTDDSRYDLYLKKPGEYDICIKAADKNNLVADRYFRITVLPD